jgi:hypothetical protein
MKLNLLFIVMYLFTMLAYPFVFIHSKLKQFLKARNILVTNSVPPGR